MAHEVRRVIPDAHDSGVQCCAYNERLHIYYTGGQDAKIKLWESETGKLLRTLSVEPDAPKEGAGWNSGEIKGHTGWITSLVYCHEYKLLFSCSLDGKIILWSSKGDKYEEIKTKKPLYCMAVDFRRDLLVLGGHSYVMVLTLNKDNIEEQKLPMVKESPYFQKLETTNQDLISTSDHTTMVTNALFAGVEKKIVPPLIIESHTDIVRAIVISENGKMFTSGYDAKVCVYECERLLRQDAREVNQSKRRHSSMPQSLGTSRTQTSNLGTARSENRPARGMKSSMTDVGENSVMSQGLGLTHEPLFKETPNVHTSAISSMAFDTENNWIITGSYDRVVKILAGDGRIMQTFHGFNDVISGICYIPQTKNLWVASNSPIPVVYDPRTGMNITDYLAQQLAFDVPSRLRVKTAHHIVRLFGFPEASEIVGVTNLNDLVIWKFNPLAASSVIRGHTDWIECITATSFGAYNLNGGGMEGMNMNSDEEEDPDMSFENFMKDKNMSDSDNESNVEERKTGTEPVFLFSGGADCMVKKWEPASGLNPSLYHCQESFSGHTGTILCCSINEPTGLLVTGSEDFTVRAWNVFSGPQKVDPSDVRFEMKGHEDKVTGLASIDQYVVSVSWDMSFRVWDLETGLLCPNGHNPSAHDEPIFGIEYCMERGEFATCSSDQLVHIWSFPTKNMKFKGPCELKTVLVGHTKEVNEVKWNRRHEQWVTGSEDFTIRTWSPDGAPLQVMRSRGDSITAMCIDETTGYIVAACFDRKIRVFDPIADEIVRLYKGHTDVVRCIVHVEDLNQYLTTSADSTIRVWIANPPKHFLTYTTSASPQLGADDKLEGIGQRYEDLHPLIPPKFDEVDRNMMNLGRMTDDSRRGPRDHQRHRETTLETRLNELESALKQIDEFPVASEKLRQKQTPSSHFNRRQAGARSVNTGGRTPLKRK